MTDFESRQRESRIGALVAVAACGLLFTIVFLGELVTTDWQPLQGLVSGYSLVFSLLLLASSEWLRRQPFAGDELLHIVGWVLGGVTPLAFVTWLVLLDHTALGFWATLTDIAHVAVIGAVGGLLIGVVVVRQRQTNTQLEHTRSHLESVLDASPLPVVAVDDEGYITTWNPAAEHTFGWSAEGVLGTRLPSTATASGFDELLDRFRTGELVDGIEERRRTSAGDLVDVRTYFSPIYDGDEITGGMAIVRDITEEKQQQAELERSRDLLTWTEEMANVGGWELDLRTDAVQWTDGTRRIHEVDDDFEPDLDSALEFYQTNHRETVETLVERAIEVGEPYDVELRLVTATGKDRWVEVRGEPVEMDDGPGYIRGAIRDISERKEHEQRLMVLNRVLRHNLRNDLNVIQGRAEMLHEDLADLDIPRELRESADVSEFVASLSGVATTSQELHTQISRFLDGIALLEEFPLERAQGDAQTILRKSGELASLGEKARQFDRVISNTDSGTAQVVEVHDLLERVANRYRSRFPNASVAVNSEAGIRVAGTPDQLESAIGELVENAIKHSGDSTPEVTITVSHCSRQRVDICVADRGPGLPKTELATLHRGEETPLVHGKGLGLWLVNWAISRMDGSVSVADNEPTGTRVTITLPAVGEGTNPPIGTTGDD